MGTKKQAEKSKKLWIKVLAVIAGVIFVVLMVVSAMGSSWITSFTVVKPGDVAVVDYTLRDAQGTPIMTSNQQLYTQLASQGSGVLYSKQLTITANTSLATGVFPIAFYTASTGWSTQNQFALFSTEYNAISSGIVGLKANSQKTISLSTAKPMTQFWSADQLAASNMSLSSVQIGELIALGVSSSANAAQANSTEPAYVRIGEVSNKTPDGITIDFSYPSVDVTVVSINQASS
ncbi:MAG: hypothetical protein WAU66_08015 [Methanoregula sp.]|uniref:hypothetical protein n=1 Tax=Methanoregula sp. TaxID=2052170 RepID=UPI003BB0A060